MSVTSQLPIQTTNFSVVVLTCTCAPQLWKTFHHPWYCPKQSLIYLQQNVFNRPTLEKTCCTQVFDTVLAICTSEKTIS